MDCGGKRSATPLWMNDSRENPDRHDAEHPRRCRRCTLPPESMGPPGLFHRNTRSATFGGFSPGDLEENVF